MRFSRRPQLALLLTALIFSSRPGRASTQPDRHGEIEAADAAFRSEDWPAAARAYEELVRELPDSGLSHFRLGVARLSLGQLDSGLTELDAAEKLGWPPNQVAYRKGCAHAAAGRLDRAIAELERAMAAGFSQTELAAADPLLANLRKDPRWAPLLDRIERSAHPCKYDSRYRAFDYWLGTWDVRPNGKPEMPPAENIVTREYDGCVVHEHWKSPNSAGESFNIFDVSREEWFQTWVDNGGGLHQYHGNPDAKGDLSFMTDLQYSPGQKRRPTRLRFIKLGPDQVRQLSEQSSDGGKTWTVNYDLIYTRRGI
jgi:hypothetical protein